MIDVAAGVLLHTCAVIWLANGDLPHAAVSCIVQAGLGGRRVRITHLRLGDRLLSTPRGNRPALRLLPDAKTWFTKIMARPGIWEAVLTPEIAIDASYLPGDMHADPADRLLVATARHLGIPIVTRDTRIIAYAGQGFVEALAC